MSYDSPLDRGSLPRIDYRVSTGAVDPGLRLYMLRVYNVMAAALGLTGLVAYVAVATGFYQQSPARP
jgi:FtsH-binding integral membrane protein